MGGPRVRLTGDRIIPSGTELTVPRCAALMAAGTTARYRAEHENWRIYMVLGDQLCIFQAVPAQVVQPVLDQILPAPENWRIYMVLGDQLCIFQAVPGP
jgi:hypothetical protein